MWIAEEMNLQFSTVQSATGVRTTAPIVRMLDWSALDGNRCLPPLSVGILLIT